MTPDTQTGLSDSDIELLRSLPITMEGDEPTNWPRHASLTLLQYADLVICSPFPTMEWRRSRAGDALLATIDRLHSEHQERERELRGAAARVMELHNAGVLTIDHPSMSESGHEGSSALIRLARALSTKEKN